MENIKIKALDGLELDCLLIEAENPKACVQIVHGMTEHKKRYIEFMEYLAKNGYNVIIADLRGHGKSVDKKYRLGHIESTTELISDQYQVTKYLKEKYPTLDVYMYGHSMGSLISRNYIKFHDTEIKKLILSGTVAYNGGCKLGMFIGKIRKTFNRYAYSKLLWAFSNNASFKEDLSWLSYNKDNITKYENDPLCTFKFDVSANYVLFNLVSNIKKKYKCKNPNLKIISFSGKDDRTTKGEKGLRKCLSFLKNDGYNDVRCITFENMKHEILHEDNREEVFKATVKFFND